MNTLLWTEVIDHDIRKNGVAKIDAGDSSSTFSKTIVRAVVVVPAVPVPSPLPFTQGPLA